MRRLGRVLWRVVRYATLLAVVILLVLSGIGQWYNPGIVKLESLGPPPVTTTTTASSVIDLGVSPAANVMMQLLNLTTPSFTVSSPATSAAPSDPLLASCKNVAIPVPQLTASENISAPSGQEVLAISVYSAGLGARALYLKESAIRSCGYSYVTGSLSSPANGFLAATTYQGINYQEATLGSADVVISILAFPGTSPTAVSQDLSTLSLSLASSLPTILINNSCINPEAPPSQYIRNPTQAGYVGLLSPQTVPVPSGDIPPKESLLNAVPPTYPAPPAGTIVYPPTQPIPPTYPPTAATIELPQVDLTGPGCGWAFTGTATPSVPVANANRLASAAITSLLDKWAAWPSQVTTYLNAVATYNADLASYNLWRTTPTTAPATTTTTTTTTTIPVTTTTTVPPTTTIPAG